MAKALRMPLEEAEDCITDLLDMEREELHPVREAKVRAAYRDMAGQRDKESETSAAGAWGGTRD